MPGTVHFVHAVDTEGPLHEPVGATFERLNDLFQLRHVAPTRQNLQRLQAGEIDLGELTGKVRAVLQGHRLRTLGSWDEIDRMLDIAMSEEFRARLPDADGNGWTYSWFCMDHVGYLYNPRRRDIGFHNVFDHYRERLAAAPGCRDELQFHFHPMSTYREAHRCATHYLRTPELYEIVARRIVERDFFPAVYRAGFQAERPDSHWWLEQWVPFDISNMALEDNSALDDYSDFRLGRSANWRWAPADWSTYHPSHDDYQVPGQCRRLIARCLNVLSRVASLDEAEVEKAFRRAAAGRDTIVGVCSHDWRNMVPEVEHVRGLIAAASARFPGVPFRFSPATEAFRSQLPDERRTAPALKLEIDFAAGSAADVPHLTVTARQGHVFGPQPFLAICTKGRRFIHDNLDFVEKDQVWGYAFHGDTLPVEDVLEVAVGAADACGRTAIARWRPD
jgi:hypothetical protein